MIVAGATDIGTWVTIGLFFAFWLADGVQMLRRRATESQKIGEWEKGHLWRYILVGGFFIFIAAHLVFFP